MRLRAIAASLCIACGLLVLAGPPASAGTNYYVDSAASCPGSGTIGSPYCSLSSINSHAAFVGGDQILLKRGSTFNLGNPVSTSLKPSGSGTSLSNMITIDAYGTGAAPILDGQLCCLATGSGGTVSYTSTTLTDTSKSWTTNQWAGGYVTVDSVNYQLVASNTATTITLASAWVPSTPSGGTAYTALYISVGISLTNQSYWAIRNLEIKNVQSAIQPTALTSGTVTGYRLSDIYVHDNLDGIYFATTGTAAFSDIRVDDVESAHNRRGVRFDKASNILVNRVYSHDSDQRSWTNVANYCSNSLSFAGGTNRVVMNTISSRAAGCAASSGTTAASFFGDSSDGTFVNSILSNVHNTGSNDQAGINFEANNWAGSNTNSRIRNSLLADNAGPGVEVLLVDHPANGCSPQKNVTGAEVSGNVFMGNGWTGPSGTDQHTGGMWTWRSASCTSAPTGTVSDNLSAEPYGFKRTNPSGTWSGVTFSNNLDAGPASELTYAANDFSAYQHPTNTPSRWRYQTSTDGTSFTDLAYFNNAKSTDPRWQPASGTTSPYVGRFEQYPSSTSTTWVSRSWTAPATGTVSIRGRGLRTDTTCNGGAVVRIQRNTTTILSDTTINSTTDPNNTGITTNLDTVSVTSGDVLRFMSKINGTSQCALSWSPAIGYVNMVSNPGFEEDLTGWTLFSGSNATVTGGAATGYKSAYAQANGTQVGNMYQIFSGWSAGDTVILSGYGKTGAAGQTGKIGLFAIPTWNFICSLSFSETVWTYKSTSCTIPAGTTVLESVVNTDQTTNGNKQYGDGITVVRQSSNVAPTFVTNGGFEQGTASWTKYSGKNAVLVESGAPQQTMAMYVEADGAAIGDYYQDVTSWAPGDSLTLSNYGMVGGAGQTGYAAILAIPSFSFICQTSWTETAWTHKSSTCTVPAGTSTLRLAFYTNATTNGHRMYADAIKLTKN